MTDNEIENEIDNGLARMAGRADEAMFNATYDLPEGDLLREIILGLVPSLCAIDLSTDPEIRRKTFWWLRDELNRYASKCREKAVTLELARQSLEGANHAL